GTAPDRIVLWETANSSVEITG
ncbi:MAG: hypothetical protein QOI61_2066, partial [Actinomycetota bacterium]